jgi:hypothetical protein
MYYTVAVSYCAGMMYTDSLVYSVQHALFGVIVDSELSMLYTYMAVNRAECAY